jgi:hypothetical protein
MESRGSPDSLLDEHDIDPLPGAMLGWDRPHGVRFTWGTGTITFELTRACDGGTILRRHLGAECEHCSAHRRRLGDLPGSIGAQHR